MFTLVLHSKHKLGLSKIANKIHYTYLSLDQLHPLVSSFDNGTRNVYQSLSSNLVEDIVNGDVSACATNTSTTVDEDGSFGWLMLGLDSTVEPKNGRGIFRHSVIRPGSEMKQFDPQHTTITTQLQKCGRYISTT